MRLKNGKEVDFSAFKTPLNQGLVEKMREIMATKGYSQRVSTKESMMQKKPAVKMNLSKQKKRTI